MGRAAGKTLNEFLRVKPEARRLTFRQIAPAFELHLRTCGGRHGAPAKPATVRTHMSALRAIVFPHLGDHFIDAVDIEIVKAFVLLLIACGYAPKTRGRVNYTLSEVFQYAISIGAAQSNPMRDIPRELRPPKRVRDKNRSRLGVLTVEEIRALLLSTEIPFERQLLYAILIFTGARVGEAVSLQWGDIVLEMQPLGQLAIRRSWDCKAETGEPGKRGALVATKTDEVRYVPIARFLQRMLIRKRDLYIQANGRAPLPETFISECMYWKRPTIWNPPTLLEKFRGDLARVGIATPVSGKRRTHDTRHTFTTQLSKAGVEIHRIEAMTHAGSRFDLGSVGEYLHYDHSDLCDAIARLDRILEGNGT